MSRLPVRVQRQASEAYQQFRRDPWHNSLRFKQVRGKSDDVYSARVGHHYRVLGIRDGDRITWFWIGSHAEYDQLVERL